MFRCCPCFCFSFCRRLISATRIRANIYDPACSMSLGTSKIGSCCRELFLKQSNFLVFFTIRNEIVRELLLGFNIWPFFSITQTVKYVAGQPKRQRQCTFINLFPLFLFCALSLLRYLLAHMAHVWLFDVINLVYLLFSLIIIYIEKPTHPKIWKVEVV